MHSQTVFAVLLKCPTCVAVLSIGYPLLLFLLCACGFAAVLYCIGVVSSSLTRLRWHRNQIKYASFNAKHDCLLKVQRFLGTQHAYAHEYGRNWRNDCSLKFQGKAPPNLHL